MLRTRVIPALLLREESLVKTVRFGPYTYVGDPCNTVRIFNELEVDELVFLDITASKTGQGPNLSILADIANECFMPLAYGGGVRNFEDAQAILRLGFEKIIVNTHALERPPFLTELAQHFGSQAVVASIDVKRDILGRPRVFSHSGSKNTHRDPVQWAQEVERLGAGEILLTSIEKEGSWSGFDLDLVKRVTSSVGVPVVAQGGAGTLAHLAEVVNQGGASAVGVGSMVVFQRQGMGVLINFPTPRDLAEALAGPDKSNDAH